MGIDLREFASGDTDYIAKMNANVATLEDAINGLMTQIAAIPGAATSGFLMDTLFNSADALIGPGSYKPTPSGNTLNIAPGGAFLKIQARCVQSFAIVPISFVGAPADTYYIVIDPNGLPRRATDPEDGTAYSVFWNGSGLSALTKIMPVYFDTVESEASRSSATLAKTHSTLDARLEAGEVHAKEAKEDAQEAIDLANEALAAIEFAKAEPPPTYRKVGCTVDFATGVKGAIQLDFAGTIVGWSIIADAACTLTVEVDRKVSAQPPAVPAIPNAGGADKISASAPIQLTGAQSASRGTAGVATWMKDLKQWDVIQFRTTNALGLTRATLYLRILQAPRDTGLGMAFIPSTAQAGDSLLLPYGPQVLTVGAPVDEPLSSPPEE